MKTIVYILLYDSHKIIKFEMRKNIIVNFRSIGFLACIVIHSLCSCTTKNNDSIYYLYQNTLEDPIKSAYDYVIEFKNLDSNPDGWFWGNTDIYDVFKAPRNAFCPGYFVLRMNDIKKDGDSISFVIDSDKTTFFSQPISTGIHSAKEAVDSAYNKWRVSHRFFYGKALFKGVIYPDSLVLYQENVHFSANGLFSDSRLFDIKKENGENFFEEYYRFVFVKKSKEFISTHDRSLSAEEELKNRKTPTSIDPFETGKCVYDEMQWMDDYEE